MKEPRILMLAWEEVPGQPAILESWVPVAQHLAVREPVQVILPRADTRLKPKNISITALNEIILPLSHTPAGKPASYPFAPLSGPGPPQQIPLYGTAIYTGPAKEWKRQSFPGEAVPAGHLTVPGEGRDPRELPLPPVVAGIHAQVIAFARKAIRFAQTQHYTTIYAFHWQTFLAALELKLITGKRLVVRIDRINQVAAVSYKNGWIEDLKRQAVEKADAILLDNGRIVVERESPGKEFTGKII